MSHSPSRQNQNPFFYLLLLNRGKLKFLRKCLPFISKKLRQISVNGRVYWLWSWLLPGVIQQWHQETNIGVFSRARKIRGKPGYWGRSQGQCFKLKNVVKSVTYCWNITNKENWTIELWFRNFKVISDLYKHCFRELWVLKSKWLV